MLTAQRELFCQEYVVDFNGAQAAIRAGYAANSARQQAARLLTNDDVATRIAALSAKTTQKLELSREFVVLGLMGIALHGQGSSQVRAYELLGKHLAMFTDRLEVTQITKDALQAEIERLEAELADH